MGGNLCIWPGADDDLRALWATGMATAAIGERLGVSKSAVVGRAHRLDLPSRPSPIINPRPDSVRARRAAQPKRAPKITLAIDNDVAVRLNAPPPVVYVRRRGQCQWPIGEPGSKSFRVCDDPTERGKPYCTDHCKLAYVRVRDRREDAA